LAPRLLVSPLGLLMKPERRPVTGLTARRSIRCLSPASPLLFVIDRLAAASAIDPRPSKILPRRSPMSVLPPKRAAGKGLLTPDSYIGAIIIAQRLAVPLLIGIS